MHHRVFNLTGKLSLFSEFVGETRGEEERSSIVHDSMQASSCKLTNFEVFFFFFATLSLFIYFLFFKETSISTSVLLFSNIERLLRPEDVYKRIHY